MQPVSFWKEALLGEFANDCIWHTIVPTTMVTVAGTWEKASSELDMSDEITVKAQRSVLSCVFCGCSTETRKLMIAIRVLFGKRMVCPSHYSYRFGASLAAICGSCAEVVYPPSDNVYVHVTSDMIRYVMLRLDNFATQLCSEENALVDLSGPTAWECIVEAFVKHRDVITQKFGKRRHMCGYCGKDWPINRCSACNFIYYCDEECSRAAWDTHKTQCGKFKNIFIFRHDPIDMSKSSKMLRDIIATRLGKK